ncbi:MAG: DNA alkylation repair protein, partial [Candidatus Levybacteria bacterium]|nr:DNA alkylation repair protein [Candidatus Levybacteria bacterium]
GLSVPQSRTLAIKYKDLPFEDIGKLLRSEFHEERLIALHILVHQFQHEEMLQRRIYEFYLKNTKFVNNWDLVDLSSDKIVGGYLIDKPKAILYKLAKSSNPWERRIAMISSYNFIKNNMFDDALSIAEILIEDKNDLIQKAVGWMLREVGKRNLRLEEKFLKKHYKLMGRVTLRYATEKFPEKVRKQYLAGLVR